MAALNKLAEGDVETDEKRELLASVGAFVDTCNQRYSLNREPKRFHKPLPKQKGQVQGGESKHSDKS